MVLFFIWHEYSKYTTQVKVNNKTNIKIKKVKQLICKGSK